MKQKKINLTENQIARAVVGTAIRLLKEGTANFYVKNAQSYYVVGSMANEDDEEEGSDEFLIEDLTGLADNMGWDGYQQEEWDSNDGVIFAEKQFGDFTAKLICRYGYYQGAVLDYEIVYSEDNGMYLSNYDNEQDFVEDIVSFTMDCYNEEVNPDEIMQELQSAREEAEATCKQMSGMELRCSAQFSNGETWYERV